MPPDQDVSASLEDYLEATYHIEKEKGAARAKDIAQRLKFKGASVTGALKSLSSKGFINYAPYDLITLTPEGKIIAEDVVRRHETLKRFFVKILLVDRAEAEESACKMEHSLPRPILERMIKFMEFIEVCPRVGENWVKGFGYFFEKGEFREDCGDCMSHCLEKYQKENRNRNSGDG
jgi:DtxR family transcriptional regulator, Mn-dependent transcriptional regulator